MLLEREEEEMEKVDLTQMVSPWKKQLMGANICTGAYYESSIVLGGAARFFLSMVREGNILGFEGRI